MAWKGGVKEIQRRTRSVNSLSSSSSLDKRSSRERGVSPATSSCGGPPLKSAPPRPLASVARAPNIPGEPGLLLRGLFRGSRGLLSGSILSGSWGLLSGGLFSESRGLVLGAGLSLWTSSGKITSKDVRPDTSGRPCIRTQHLPCRPLADNLSTRRSALADSMADGHPTSGRPLRPSVERQTATLSAGWGGGRPAG
jgi:hypothetical protein